MKKHPITPGQEASLSEIVQQADKGDAVIFAPGRYHFESAVTIPSGVNLYGAGPETIIATIDGPAFEFRSSDSAPGHWVVTNLSLQGCKSSRPSGALDFEHGEALLQRVSFAGNQAPPLRECGASAISARGVQLMLHHCEFRDNIGGEAAIVGNDTDFSVRESQFSNNSGLVANEIYSRGAANGSIQSCRFDGADGIAFNVVPPVASRASWSVLDCQLNLAGPPFSIEREGLVDLYLIGNTLPESIRSTVDALALSGEEKKQRVAGYGAGVLIDGQPLGTVLQYAEFVDNRIERNNYI